jgi:hypothetical protein
MPIGHHDEIGGNLEAVVEADRSDASGRAWFDVRNR